MTAQEDSPLDVPWPVAVFAHNEQATIEASLDCLPAAASGHPISIYVLANGCTDQTETIVRKRSEQQDNLHLVSIAKADKAGAWNAYVHGHASQSPVHFFTDADVLACQHSLAILAETLAEHPVLNAVGAVPTTGRRRAVWQHKMETLGILAGNLYALPGTFVARLRAKNVRAPSGFIGEDFLVSFLAATNLLEELPESFDGSLVAFNRMAGFAFRSLSPWRRGDWPSYYHRKVRYSLRRLQNLLLFDRLERHGLESMPNNVAQLYRETAAADFPPLIWRGHDTCFDLIARRRIKRQVGGSR